MDDNSFPKGRVISWSLARNHTGISQEGKCSRQDIVSEKTSLVAAAFSSERDIFPPPPVTQRRGMPSGRLSSGRRGHGTGLEPEGLFIFYVCWTMLFSGCEHNFLTFTNDPQEKTLPAKTGPVAEPCQKSTSFPLMSSSQREYSFKRWIVFWTPVTRSTAFTGVKCNCSDFFQTYLGGKKPPRMCPSSPPWAQQNPEEQRLSPALMPWIIPCKSKPRECFGERPGSRRDSYTLKQPHQTKLLESRETHGATLL